MNIERKLASIRIISQIEPIVGADAIELALVDGWQCVIAKKDNFQVNEEIVFCEIDSVMPDIPEFEFLRDRNFRIKTIRLRGQISQGLILKKSILGKNAHKYGFDADVTKVLGITKYEPVIVRQKVDNFRKPKNKLMRILFRYKIFRYFFEKKDLKKPFPRWIQKTDEERIQNIRNYPILVEYGKYFVTEKIDGQSGTFFIESNNKIGICSRNYLLSFKEDSNYLEIYEKYELGKVLKAGKKFFSAKRFVIQGEIAGPTIQSNNYQFVDKKFYIFNMLCDKKIVNYVDMVSFINHLKTIIPNIEFLLVPLIDKDFTLKSDVASMVEYSKGKSVVNPKVLREGVVIRSFDYKHSFKVINPLYLLSKDE
jgi:hypothetical protein